MENKPAGRFVSYLRVSTQRQGAAGLGVEAQRGAVRRFIDGNGAEPLAEFVEVESGRRADRPELERALACCRTHNAVLVIAKLDRLARNVEFTARLMNSGVEFAACDFPQANRLTVHILAAVATLMRGLMTPARTNPKRAVSTRPILPDPAPSCHGIPERDMERNALIDIAYGEADVAEFDTELQVPRPTRLGRAVEAGLTTIAMFFSMGVGVLAAGGLAAVFVATLPWSLMLYLAAAVTAALAIGRRNWCTAAAPRLDR